MDNGPTSPRCIGRESDGGDWIVVNPVLIGLHDHRFSLVISVRQWHLHPWWRLGLWRTSFCRMFCLGQLAWMLKDGMRQSRSGVLYDIRLLNPHIAPQIPLKVLVSPCDRTCLSLPRGRSGQSNSDSFADNDLKFRQALNPIIERRSASRECPEWKSPGSGIRVTVAVRLPLNTDLPLPSALLFHIAAMSNLPSEPEFEQALHEIATTLEPFLVKNPEYRRAFAVVQIPERVIQFRVTWETDSGELRVNRGYRVQCKLAYCITFEL